MTDPISTGVTAREAVSSRASAAREGGRVPGGSGDEVRREIMRVPLILRIGALVIATTGFYPYVGQMVPQKEVQPPAEIVLKTDLSTAEMAKIGREIMEGK